MNKWLISGDFGLVVLIMESIPNQRQTESCFRRIWKLSGNKFTRSCGYYAEALEEDWVNIEGLPEFFATKKSPYSVEVIRL